MNWTLLIALCSLLFLCATHGNGTCDYCAIDRDNTYCHNYRGFAEGCSHVFFSGVKTEEKEAIVNTHNAYRRKVAKGEEPGLGAMPAANMVSLQWDEELARGAQMWANQCHVVHDSRDVCRFEVGQNLYYHWSDQSPPVVDWGKAMEWWYSEVLSYKGNIANYDTSDKGQGHFTQMIWAETKYIGCGQIAHRASDWDSWNKLYYVCNYGPAGNRWGTPVFTEGEPCSLCPDGSTCVDGLCDFNKPTTPTTTTTTTNTATAMKECINRCLAEP